MKVLIIGGGGREHALAWKIAQSPKVDKIYCTPGNPGMKGVETVPITDLNELADFAVANKIDLTMVGPEASLIAGVADIFRARGLRICAPSKEAAQLEGSKSYAKDFMRKYGLPTADAQLFTDAASALAYARCKGAPLVVKADGLAAGKGVTVAMTLPEAEEAINACFSGAFGEAGYSVLIEECLFGEEASIIALCDGKTIIPLASSQDHKRAFDGDKGPNTGGMGAYSPVPFITEKDFSFALECIMKPVAAGMVAEGCPFKGVLYGGLMKTPAGIKVIEFNARFGDPETEVVLPLLNSDIYDIFYGIATNDSRIVAPVWEEGVTLGVVLASKGYPGHYQKGYPITGLACVKAKVYHMGTAITDDNLVTNGGRVLMVVAGGKDVADARKKVYKEISKINCDNLFYRTDIAHCALDK